MKRHKGADLGTELSRVPDEILCFILSLLHPLYLYKSRLVCRRWNSLIMNEVDLKVVWAKQEPWLLVCTSNWKSYEIWCPASGVRFPFPASLVPRVNYWTPQVANYQGLALSMKDKGLMVWAPLTGANMYIPCPPADFRLRDIKSLCYACDLWADAEKGMFKLGLHTATGVHLYDPAACSWVFEETPSKIRELGKLVSVPSANAHNPFSTLTSYARQYAISRQKGADKWKQWPNPDKLPRFDVMFRDEKGCCFGVILNCRHPPCTISLLRLHEGPVWVCLGKITLYDDVDMCSWSMEPLFQIICSGDYIVVGMGGFGETYPSRVAVFNTETHNWNVLHSGVDDDVYVRAFFRPDLISYRTIEKFIP